jgi:hypothetical protein
MMKRMSLTTGVAIGLLASAACERDAETGAQVPSSQGGVAAQTSFTLVDRNGDGAVSREEASTVADLDFSAADTDRNSQLSPDEYRTAMEAARPRG